MYSSFCGLLICPKVLEGSPIFDKPTIMMDTNVATMLLTESDCSDCVFSLFHKHKHQIVFSFSLSPLFHALSQDASATVIQSLNYEPPGRQMSLKIVNLILILNGSRIFEMK